MEDAKGMDAPGHWRHHEKESVIVVVVVPVVRVQGSCVAHVGRWVGDWMPHWQPGGFAEAGRRKQASSRFMRVWW